MNTGRGPFPVWLCRRHSLPVGYIFSWNIRSTYRAHLYVAYKVPLRDVCDVKSRGWRKLMKGTRRQHNSSRSLFMLKETWSKKQQGRSSCWLLLFTLNIISYSYSNPAEHDVLLFTLNLIILVQLWVAGEGSTRRHIFHARSCVRRDYRSEVMEIVSYCTKNAVSYTHLTLPTKA